MHGYRPSYGFIFHGWRVSGSVRLTLTRVGLGLGSQKPEKGFTMDIHELAVDVMANTHAQEDANTHLAPGSKNKEIESGRASRF